MGEDLDCQKYLVVDNDPQILIFLKRLLKRIHPKVLIYTAHNCTEALELLQQHHFKLIISDYELPDGTGSTILKNYEKQSIRVGISGTGVRDDFKTSCDHFLAKPFGIKEIQNILKEKN